MIVFCDCLFFSSTSTFPFLYSASRHRLASLMNIPCSTTPGILFSSFASISGVSSFHLPHAQSRIILPPSVFFRVFPFFRIFAFPLTFSILLNRFSIFFCVSFHAKVSISMGRGNAPSCGFIFSFSASMIIFLLLCASIFSRSKHPPPPLISRRCLSISSAPSIAMSISE